MRVPITREESAQMGCRAVDGTNVGTGLIGLFRVFNVDLQAMVEVGEQEESVLMLLGHLAGWEAGQTGNEAMDVDFRMYVGRAGREGVFVRPSSFVEDDPGNGPRHEYGADLTCRGLVTEPGEFRLQMPMSNEGPFAPLHLSQTTFSGDIVPAATGFSIRNGTISGYLTEDAVVELVVDLAAACDMDVVPDFCQQGAQFLGGDPRMVARTLILPILRGLDARVNADGSVSGDCSRNQTCNAVSICFGFESQPVVLEGIAP